MTERSTAGGQTPHQFLRTRIDPVCLSGVSVGLPLKASRSLSRFAFLTRDRLSDPVTRNAQLSATVAVFRVSTFLTRRSVTLIVP
jgi:hypothetical protein